MKFLFLIFGLIASCLGYIMEVKTILIIGLLLIIISFFGKHQADKTKEGEAKFFKKAISKKCPNCKAEMLSDDIYCPECGKKYLP